MIGGGLYASAGRGAGPTGTIGTNRPDGYEVAEKIAADLARAAAGARRAAPASTGCSRARGVDLVTFRDWQRIEAAEAARAREGSPREKFVAIEEMLGARGR